MTVIRVCGRRAMVADRCCFEAASADANSPLAPPMIPLRLPPHRSLLTDANPRTMHVLVKHQPPLSAILVIVGCIELDLYRFATAFVLFHLEAAQHIVRVALTECARELLQLGRRSIASGQQHRRHQESKEQKW